MNVGVLVGGCSPEHDVSLASAAQVLQHLDRTRWRVWPVLLTRDGSWRPSRQPLAVDEVWSAVGALHQAGLSHGSIDVRDVWLTHDAGLQLGGFSDAALHPTDEQRCGDGVCDAIATAARAAAVWCKNGAERSRMEQKLESGPPNRGASPPIPFTGRVWDFSTQVRKHRRTILRIIPERFPGVSV